MTSITGGRSPFGNVQSGTFVSNSSSTSSTSSISSSDVQLGVMLAASISPIIESGNLSEREVTDKTGTDSVSVNLSDYALDRNEIDILREKAAKYDAEHGSAQSTPAQPTPARSTPTQPTTAQSTTNSCFCYECNNACCQCLDIICCTQDINPPPCCPPSPACCAYTIGFHSSCCQKVICCVASGVLTLVGLYIAQGKMGV